MPIVPGHDRAGRRPRREAVELAEAIGYPIAVKAAAGGGGKGIEVVRAGRGRAARAARAARREGAGLLRRRHRLRRALPGRPAPRRGAGAGRRARQRRAPGRARLLDPAPPPEDRRGDAVAGRRRRAARARSARSAVDAARAVGYVNAGTVECLLAASGDVLLPRDEHAPPGRAHDHRDGDRASTSCASSSGSRPGEPLSFAPGRRAARAATRSSAASTPRTRCAASCPTPGRDHALPRAGRAGRARRLGRRRGRRGHPELYDPMVAKLIVWDSDRDRARRRMLRRAGRVRGRGRRAR